MTMNSLPSIDSLAALAERFETREFLDSDPSRFMHEVEGGANREAAAFIASSLSFGARQQFMPRIHKIIHEFAKGEVEEWVRSGAFERDLPLDCSDCFYRFYTVADVCAFLRTYRCVMLRHGSLGACVREECGGDGARAISVICRLFGASSGGVIPKDAKSACKRLCMFLRWMVRSGSPVDLGLWADFIDRRTLVMPLDTHVLKQAQRLGLLPSGAASFSAARRLTAKLAAFFPGDPLKGDFALFGLGIQNAAEEKLSTCV